FTSRPGRILWRRSNVPLELTLRAQAYRCPGAFGTASKVSTQVFYADWNKKKSHWFAPIGFLLKSAHACIVK
uniref:Uncharacterized protein n=1 Tax=Anopheles dirus TaxID=7168 RepID=A0A182NXS8_9DIPT